MITSATVKSVLVFSDKDDEPRPKASSYTQTHYNLICTWSNGPFPSSCLAKFFLRKLVFIPMERITNYHHKNFALKTRFEEEADMNSEMAYYEPTSDSTYARARTASPRNRSTRSPVEMPYKVL